MWAHATSITEERWCGTNTGNVSVNIKLTSHYNVVVFTRTSYPCVGVFEYTVYVRKVRRLTV